VKRKLVIALAVVAGLTVLMIAVVALTLPSGSVATSDDGTHTVELAMLTVPIAEEEPLVEAPNQYFGMPHPDPEFDTIDLGPNFTFDQDTSNLPALDPDQVLRAVYLGHDIHGQPYYIWQSGSPDLRRMIGQIIADFGAVGRLGSSYGGLVVGPAPWESARKESIAERGLTDGSIRSSSSESTTFTIEWHALPKEVVAVALYDDGEPVGWQRPVSGTAAFQFDMGSQDPQSVWRGAEMVALTTTGEEWNRYAPFPGG
jgi:hypothetical protein